MQSPKTKAQQSSRICADLIEAENDEPEYLKEQKPAISEMKVRRQRISRRNSVTEKTYTSGEKRITVEGPFSELAK